MLNGRRQAVTIGRGERTHVNEARGRIDSRQLRDALGRFATGVTVVTTRTPDGKLEGLTANSFSALSLEPPLVLWSIRRDAPSLDGFAAAGAFVVNVLTVEQVALARRFSTPQADKFAGVAWRAGHCGCPVLAGSLAVFECETERTFDGGDHVIVVGRIVAAEHRDGVPLVFCGGAYGGAVPLPEDAGSTLRRA
jgi:flavin reductase (DIM6/NTAB) family NADH-FMN oxidoreductase RutF